MSLATIALVVCSIIIIALLWRFVFGPRKAAQEDPEIASVEKENAVLAEAFYAATQSGEKTRNLVRVYSQTDIAAIKALLASEGIAIVQLGPRVNVMRTESQLPGLGESVYVVLEKNYRKAIEILKDYNGSIADEAGASAGAKGTGYSTGLSPEGFGNSTRARKPELL